MSQAVSNAEIVREILRTLSRMRETILANAYWRLFSELAIELYGEGEMHMYAHRGEGGPTLAALSESRRDDLRNWLATSPQYAFSLVVGIATDDENAAWGFAYG